MKEEEVLHAVTSNSVDMRFVSIVIIADSRHTMCGKSAILLGAE
jgi:hypothetical protein